MILTGLVPEYTMGKAFGEWRAAVNGSHQISRALKDTGPGWGMVHAYMANMGHFVLDFSDPLDKRRDNTNGTAEPHSTGGSERPWADLKTLCQGQHESTRYALCIVSGH